MQNNSTTDTPQPSEEKIGDIPAPPQTTPSKNTFDPKPNHLLSKLYIIPDPPKFPPKTHNYQRRVIFVRSDAPKPSEEPQPRESAKPRPVVFHCDHCGRDGHREEYCWRKRCEVRQRSEMGNKDMYHPSHGVPEPREPLPRGEGVVRNVPRRDARGFTGHAVP